jgi:hypothetical protein
MYWLREAGSRAHQCPPAKRQDQDDQLPQNELNWNQAPVMSIREQTHHVPLD